MLITPGEISLLWVVHGLCSVGSCWSCRNVEIFIIKVNEEISWTWTKCQSFTFVRILFAFCALVCEVFLRDGERKQIFNEVYSKTSLEISNFFGKCFRGRIFVNFSKAQLQDSIIQTTPLIESLLKTINIYSLTSRKAMSKMFLNSIFTYKLIILRCLWNPSLHNARTLQRSTMSSPLQLLRNRKALGKIKKFLGESWKAGEVSRF